MLKRYKILWVFIALLVLLLAFNFISFRAARSTTGANHTLSTYRMGDTLPANMMTGFDLSYSVNGDERFVAELEKALKTEIEAQTAVGTATAVPGPPEIVDSPLLLVDLTSDRLWTPFYGKATIMAQIFYAYDGQAPWPLEEPVALLDSPAVKADGTFTLEDTTWGILSKPAYIEHLAQSLAKEIATGLQNDPFTSP